jgi:hypothetical protein
VRALTAGVVVQKKLAPGWAESVDADSGKSFYFNAETSETTWEKPVSEGDVRAV